MFLVTEQKKKADAHVEGRLLFVLRTMSSGKMRAKRTRISVGCFRQVESIVVGAFRISGVRCQNELEPQ